MNIRSAELLNQTLQNAADNIYRNRALEASTQEETQRNAIEQSFRNAMMQHYANVEERQAEGAGLQEQRLKAEDDATEKKYGVMQAMQALSEAQGNMAQGLQELSLDTKLSPAQKTQYFRQSIDSQPQYKGQFLQNPMWNALYQGQGDWDAVGQSVRQYRATNGNGMGGTARTGVNQELQKEINRAPQQMANAMSQADPNVPKDPATGKPTLPVTYRQSDAQNLGMRAGILNTAGFPAALPTSEALTYGTNATLIPNITPGVKGYLGGGPTTNSFTLTPGGIDQQALANVEGYPDGTNLLQAMGIQIPGQAQSPPAFGSSSDVRAAYQAGKIDKPTATQILQTQFGMP